MDVNDPGRLEALVAGMLDEDADEDTRYARAADLARLGRPGVERALRLARDPNPNARAMACYTLGGARDPERTGYAPLRDGVPTLLYLLHHEEHPQVLAAAGCALGHQSDDPSFAEAIPRLCELAAHADPEVRDAVAFSLGSFRIGTAPDLFPAVQQALLALTRDPDDDVRDWAVFGLHRGSHDTPEVRACFWRALDDPCPEVRGEAAAGLARFGDRSFLPRLEQLLREDDDLPVCYFEAAEGFGDPMLLPAVLEGERRWREYMDEGQVLHHYITSAIKALSPASGHHVANQRDPDSAPGD